MTSTTNSSETITTDRMLAWALSITLLLSPILGCSSEQTNTPMTSASSASNDADTEGGVWQYITKTTSSGLNIVSAKCLAGSNMVVDATQTAWIWSTDKAADGWTWIAENAGDATEWARDTANQTWTITKRTSGELSLWVRTTTENGIAWTRTAIPAAWKVTKDNAGKAWVWIKEHKVEITVAAAIVSAVAVGLLVAPESVGPAVVSGAVNGVSKHATSFLAALWLQVQSDENATKFEGVTEDLFMTVGKSVLSSCGTQLLQGAPIG